MSFENHNDQPDPVSGLPVLSRTRVMDILRQRVPFKFSEDEREIDNHILDEQGLPIHRIISAEH
jgi:hypothetical protein